MKILISQKTALEIIMRGMVVTLGLVILFTSVSRTGLTIIAQETGIDILRHDPINYLVTFDDGVTAAGVYKLPEAGMLPDNGFYGFKKIRDMMWLSFSNGIDKTKISLLLADKSAAEAKALMVKDKSDRAIEAGNEAIDKLEYTNKLINQSSITDEATKQMHYQMFWAGFAYKEIFTQLGGSFDVDTTKFQKLISRIDDWNQTQEKNRYSWNF